MRDNLNTISQKVKAILEEDERARNSDDYLYMRLCELINPSAVYLPFNEVMSQRGSLGYPCYESVRRSRQKIQERYPELCAVAEVEYAREQNEETFKHFAIYGGV